jgi:hypothetical protein
MILKVEDELKSFSRIDPGCKAHWDLGVIFPAACCETVIFLNFVNP